MVEEERIVVGEEEKVAEDEDSDAMLAAIFERLVRKQAANEYCS